MTKSIAELLTGEDMEGGEQLGDCIYNFLKNKDRAQNILTNSAFGVWSLSDTEKGIGVVKFDTGSVAAPAVGATVTGANGAKAKVIRMFVVNATWGGNTATGYVILGACGLNTNTARFSDNEVLTYAGGTITVNYPDTIVQLSVTAATIAFNDTDPDTITDTGAGFGGFAAGDIIEVSGSSSNNGFYWVTGAVAATLTLHANESLTAESLGATVTITRCGQGDRVRNGDFSLNIDPPRGWTPRNSTLTTEGAGQVGNCMKVASSAGAAAWAKQMMTVEAGKIYKIGGYFKHVDSNTGVSIFVGTADEGAQYGSPVDDDMTAAWTPWSLTFEATSASCYLSLRANCTGVGQNDLFDEIFLYEITPGCTEGDNVTFDGWYKDTTLDTYRQYYDGDNLTKNGMFYSLKCVPSAAADFLSFPNNSIRARTEWYQQFIGETVSVGAWVKTWTASHARFVIDDGPTQTPSDYHTGGGDWEWLEITATIGEGATLFQIKLQLSAASALNGDTIVYVSQDMLANVPYIGEGNYVPRQQEIVWLEKSIDNHVLEAAGLSTVAFFPVNLEATCNALLPKGARAVFIKMVVSDAVSVGGNANCSTQATALAKGQLTCGCSGITNGTLAFASGWQALDSNGDFMCAFTATGAGTLTVSNFEYRGVQVN